MQLPIESLNLQMLNVGLACHNGDWNWQGVSSPFTRIYCVTKGEARLHIKASDLVPEPTEGLLSITLTPGHLYMIPAHTLHSYECKGEFEHYYLHVYEGFKNETNVLEMYEFPIEVEAQEGDKELMERMAEAHPEAQLPESDPQTYDNANMFTGYVKRYNALPLWEKMRLRGATLLLFSRFLEKAIARVWTRNERLTKVLAHVHSHLHENISVETLAGMACVTKPYLIKVFKQEFGMPPLQYINKKKMERAQLLLITEDWTVKEVAWRLGFDDHSYFIRLFKKLIGTTPMDYRRNLGGERV
jgi:AraC-like DNA-binding protein